MTIMLSPDLETTLEEQAQRQGTTAENLVLEAVREKWAVKSEPRDELEPRDEWEKSLFSVGVMTGISLSDEATSRELIYGDHD